MWQEKWKSPVLWGTLVAQVLSILVLLEVIQPTQSDLINKVFVVLIEMAVSFGIINNPNAQDKL